MQNKYGQVLKLIRSQKKPAFFRDNEYVFPAYHGLSIANLPASICQWLSCPLVKKQPFLPIIMDQFKHEYDHVILLLIDGLSLSFFKKYIDVVSIDSKNHIPGISSLKNIFIPLTSIVPSTTSAVLTTLWTGEQPIRHGMIGYELFLKEFGCITNMITQSPASFLGRKANISSAGFDPANFLPIPTLGTHFKQHGVAAHAFQHISISRSGLSQMLLKNVGNHAYRTESDLWFSVSELIHRQSNKKTFTYIYWGELDTLSHHYGPHHPRLTKEWNTFAYLLNQFISLISSSQGKTLFLLTADHGQIPTQTSAEYDLQNHPGLTNHLIMNPTGESRLPFLFIRKNHEDAVLDYISTRWNNQFNIITSEEFIQSGLLGTGDPYQGTLERLAHFVVLPKKNAFWWWVKKENHLKGRHGGLSPEEMLVPFLAVEI